MSTPVRRLRLDALLVERELAPSKSAAQALIMAGKVRHGTDRLDKPGKSVPADLPLEIEQPPRYVSRGGDKMAAALEAFTIDPQGKTVLDIGASTGGFMDCLLQHGAISATGIDVGRAQLHPRLQNDQRVTSREKVNARYLSRPDLTRDLYDFLVIDVSFISLRLIAPAVWPFLNTPGEAVFLLKPQFEASREEVAKGRGIIQEDAVRERIRDDLEQFFQAQLPSVEVVGTIECPVAGGDGNREYLTYLRKQRKS